MPDPAYTLSLNRDEALVLHEWLARVVDDENGEGLRETVEDDAEVWALNAVLVLLEQVVTEPYEETFEKQLKAARKRIREANGAWPWDAADG